MDASHSATYVDAVATAHDVPESLRRLVDAWRMLGASSAEIIDGLDQLELLAQDERLSLAKFAESGS
jgi:hypothetical protein